MLPNKLLTDQLQLLTEVTGLRPARSEVVYPVGVEHDHPDADHVPIATHVGLPFTH